MGSIEYVYQHFKTMIGLKKESNLGEVDELLIKRYALAVGEKNPLYFDREYAMKHGYPDIIAPPNLIASIMDWGIGEEEENIKKDGMPNSNEFLPENSGEVRVMGGGEEKDFFLPVIAGMNITLKSEVVDTYKKQGRKGDIAFLVIKNSYYDQDQNVLCICNRTMIAR